MLGMLSAYIIFQESQQVMQESGSVYSDQQFPLVRLCRHIHVAIDTVCECPDYIQLGSQPHIMVKLIISIATIYIATLVKSPN